MAVKIGFFLALVILTVTFLATSSVAAPADGVAHSPALSELITPAIMEVREEVGATRPRRSPQVCRHVLVHRDGVSYPIYECN